MKSIHERRSSTKNLPSFQLENQQTRNLIFKLSRSYSQEGIPDFKSNLEKMTPPISLTAKKSPLNALLDAVWSQSLRKTAMESSLKISARFSLRQKALLENKSFVG